MDQAIAYLNGQWIPAEAATVSATDAGFVWGTAVSEQLRTFAGELFRLPEHLARLRESLKIVDVDPGVEVDELAEIATRLAVHNHRLLAPGDDLGLAIFVTPGPSPVYAPPGRLQPTVCLHTYPLPFRLWAQKFQTGQALATTGVEQISGQSWPAALKCRSRMHYYLADRAAALREPGARALLLDSEGRVTETSTANVLIFTQADGLTSPPAAKVLAGISLAEVIELAEAMGIVTAQRDFTPADVASADEVLLTSTPFCLLPVTRLNGRPIASGRPGRLFGRLLAAWSRRAGVDISKQATRFAGRHLTCPQT